MSQRVLAVMLANGRQEMVQRAIRSFHSQTYQDRVLLVFDSGAEPLRNIGGDRVHYVKIHGAPGMSIGMLRNHANGLATPGALGCELIAHFDSDDWSHPERLTEQVAMLEAAGADCVGYRDMLFWRTSRGDPSEVIHCACGNDYDRHMLTVCPECSAWPDPHRGETWQFRSPNPAYILGTSMLYTRKIWERFNFKDRATAEDTLWLMEKRIRREATSSIDGKNELSVVQTDRRPRMVAALHDGNTCSTVKPGAAEWTRAAERDEFCRETMELI